MSALKRNQSTQTEIALFYIETITIFFFSLNILENFCWNWILLFSLIKKHNLGISVFKPCSNAQQVRIGKTGSSLHSHSTLFGQNLQFLKFFHSNSWVSLAERSNFYQSNFSTHNFLNSSIFLEQTALLYSPQHRTTRNVKLSTQTELNSGHLLFLPWKTFSTKKIIQYR